MSSIITFYSYKGGVGRSMALANIAVELSNRNKKVLIVDWDLEAPGIERYFSNFEIKRPNEGLLHLLNSVSPQAFPDYRDYTCSFDIGRGGLPISLLHSGREGDAAKYSSMLQSFNWNDFFSKNNGGIFLETLRELWLKDFDFVLIDSRTGLSDSSGICTILMPDVLIPMFTANYQSLFGIRDIVNFIQQARQKLEVERMALTVLPIPSRFGTRVEFKESQEWLVRISDILKECFTDWLPAWIEPQVILEQIKIPQVDYFSFGEKLAVIEHGTNDPEGMGFIFSKISQLLVSGFSEIESIVGKEHFNKSKTEFERLQTSKNPALTSNYEYDICISCFKEDYQWSKEILLPALQEYLGDELGYNPQVHLDLDAFSFTESGSVNFNNVINKSKTFIFILSHIPIDNTWFKFTFNSILTREKNAEKDLVFLIELGRFSDELSFNNVPEFREKRIFNFSKFKDNSFNKSTKLSVEFANKVEGLSSLIADSITKRNPQTVSSDGDSGFENSTENFDLLLEFAREYENVRKDVPGGIKRTRIMQGIVENMKTEIKHPTEGLSVLTKSKSAGERLLAISKLQKFPNIDYIDWLSQHVGDSEKPFIGYQASVGLFLASRTLGKENKEKFRDVLIEATNNIYSFDNKDPNQIKTIEAALSELED